uniref:DUF1985 domain-containing protein n=1 Tax=Brassica oleracea TaxID=3712 RepID=A0A3P6FU69_BRAOL|nr:unnamed protein product [Brassica oleracea]
MLGFQLDIKKKYELWSLVGPEPELTSFWEMLRVHVEAGPSTQEIITTFERCEGWSRDDSKWLAKYSTPTRVSLARLVMELERFENYPWGRVAFKVLMDSFISSIYRITRVINFVQKDIGEMFSKWEFDVEDTPAENIIKLMFVKKPWKWTMDCWKVTGTWKRIVKEDSPRSRKKARKEASEEATVEASEEVHTTVVDAKREGFGTCLKEIKYLSERVEAVEKKVGITTKRKGTSAQNTTPPPKPTLEPGSESVNGTNAGRKSLPEDKGPDKEDARYLEKRDAALALCRAKSDRTRKLAASQQSPYTTNSTAKVIIPNKKLYPGYNPFAPIYKKKLKGLADWLKTFIIEHLSIKNHRQVELGDDLLISFHCRQLTNKSSGKSSEDIRRLTSKSSEDLPHIDAWISVLRKRYDANPQHFKSERMCFLDHFFAQKWRFNYKDFKDSEPDQNSLGRRLPGGAWNYYTGTTPSFCQSNKVWGTDIDDVYRQ